MQVASAAAHHFRCPLAAGGKQALVTQYVALIGPETMWPGAQGRKLDEVTDGPAATLLLVEWPESDIVWTEPRDLPVEWLPEVLNPPEKTARGKHRHPGGINIVNADASTSFFKSTISRERLRARSGLQSAARHAAAFEQDLRHLAVQMRARLAHGRDDDFHVVEAFHLAADGTHEVGVLAVLLVLAAAEFKPPHVVTQIVPQGESRFSQLHQTTVDRGFVEPFRHEDVGHFGVALRPGGAR
jgi:hypothetical protein